MKRLLPLLFLLPSVALIVYAKREPAPEPFARVRIETGDFEFPADVRLVVVSDSLPSAIVTNGSASLPVAAFGPITLRLEGVGVPATGLDATAVPIGKPQKFTMDVADPSPDWTLVVTPEECRSALAAMRRVH